MNQLLDRNPVLGPESAVDGCLELMGELRLHDKTRQRLLEQAERIGRIRTDNHKDRKIAQEMVLRTMKMIGSTREYQFA